MKKLIALIIILGAYLNINAKSNINYPCLQLHLIYPGNTDSVKLIVEGNNAIYQKTVILDSNITVPAIYIRAIQFMASKNITQTYGYQEEGRLIFSTFQDLNINKVYVGDDNEILQTYSVQFAITLDIKNKRYRYTIHNMLFFIPTEYGNKRVNMFELYQKATNTDSRRIAKEAKKMIEDRKKAIDNLKSITTNA